MPGPHILITGANLHVRNGIGKTDSINGTGNLIVGYNAGYRASWDSVTGTVTETGNKLIGSDVEVGKEGDGFRITTKQIDEAISRLTDKMQRLTSDSEIETIKLNDLISKKGQAVQLLSNIQKRENDTQQAIIANFK